jgi:hypothetical protein
MPLKPRIETALESLEFNHLPARTRDEQGSTVSRQRFCSHEQWFRPQFTELAFGWVIGKHSRLTPLTGNRYPNWLLLCRLRRNE